MSTDDLIRQVRAGMPVVTSDGVVLGKLWRIHIRDAEAVLEVRPRTFWNAIEDIVLEVPRHANTSHLFVPAQAALEIRRNESI